MIQPEPEREIRENEEEADHRSSPTEQRQVPRDWDPSRPWSCVFMQLASDMEFWAERVHHPAAAWTAAGGEGRADRRQRS